MLSRMRLDIGWSDLAYGLAQSFLPRNRERLQRSVEQHWSANEDAIACLSVRTGFDLLLKSLNLPRGSEVLVSALTIKDMVRIIEENGLVPVPVDVDLSRLEPTLEHLSTAVTPQTRLILVAHLFGTRLNLEPVLNFARAHNLLLIEDCAQAYVGPSFTGHPHVDVSMFSFGPIKTAAALCGAILKIKDPQILARMRELQQAYIVQDRWFFLKRLFKYGGLKFASTRLAYSLLVKTCEALGKDYDKIVGSAVKGFPGPGFFERIRKRPSAPMLALLLRRLAKFNARRLAERTAKGERLAELIGNAAFIPGENVPRHSYWVFPVLTEQPNELCDALRAAGFDATKGHSLIAVPAPADRPETLPLAANELLSHVVFLPWYADMPLPALEQMAEIVRRICSADAHGPDTFRKVYAPEPTLAN